MRGTVAYVLGTLLRLLHPVVPFVTEHLWDQFGYGERCSLIRARWPEPVRVDGAEAARDELEWLVRLVGTARTVRSELNVPPSALAPVLLRGAASATLDRAARWDAVIRRMARASEVGAAGAEPQGGAIEAGLDEATLVLPLAGLVDLDAEAARLGRDRAKAEAEASKLRRKLESADFVSRAKPEVVEETRERLAAAEAEIARLDAALARISAGRR